MREIEGVKRSRTGCILLGAVFCIALVSYIWHLNVLPLADYDEATYAQVTTDTLASGHFMTLSKFGAPWFEKPPLYFWLSMGAVKLFGTEDYVFRLVSVLAVLASCLLLWYIVRRLSNDAYAATVSVLILLSWPFFYIASRQARLDVPMLSMLLVSLAALVAGWKQHRWYILIGPALALGFLFKSFAIATAIPVLLIFNFWYHNFSWLRNKFFLLGSALGVLIVVPWHWYEYARWGSGFFQNYLGQQVVARYTEGIGQNAGFQFIRYLNVLMVHGEPWIGVFTLAVIFFVGARLTSRRSERDPLLLSALSSVLAIYCLFAFGRTNILTYLLPLFPFAAIVVALFTVKLYRGSKHIYFRVLIAIVGGLLLLYSYALASGANPTTLETMYFPWSQMQKEVGLQVSKGPADARFYYFEWPTLEALRYYSDKELEAIPFPPTPGTSLSGPWFLFLTNKHLGYFVNSDGTVKPEFANLELKYTEQTGKYFLLYSEHDLEFLPR